MNSKIIAVLFTFAAIFSSATITFAQKTASARLNGDIPPPFYQIIDLGVVAQGDTASQGFGSSPGAIAVGRSIRTGGAQAFSWTQTAGTVGLPTLSGRAYCVSNSANDVGGIVGTCANSLFGTARLPVIWLNGAVSQLPLPSGETLGDANSINASGVAVGSINSGSLQRAAIYSGGTASVITQTTANGSFFTTAFGVSDSGLVVGQGIDPTNAARNVGIIYNIGDSSASEVGALSGANGALAFGVSNSNGYVVGASMMNQGAGQPFIWRQNTGIQAIPLPAGTTQGSARAVNSQGLVVGTASSAFAIPFLYSGAATYRLADLIPSGTGWDLSTNTSSSALGISDNGAIVGTGVLNGAVHGFIMISGGGASVSGRVTTAGGAGIRNALVTITGGNLSSPITVQTGSFGTYSITGILRGYNYTVSVSAKRYRFTPSSRQVTPTNHITDLDFTANND